MQGNVYKGVAIAVLAAIVPLQQAAASVIGYQSRYSTAGNFNAAAPYRTTINGLVGAAPTAGYCDKTLSVFDQVSNQSVCSGGSNQNIAFHYGIDFGVSSANAGNWSFRVGPDFGRGGALFLDGVVLGFKSDDLWWAANWGASGELLSATVANLAYGNHRFDVYGFEGCCDGTQSAQFSIGSSGRWTTFASNDSLAHIPEPGSLALFGIAALGLVTARRRK